MTSVLALTLLTALGINGLLFLIAFSNKSDKLTDISYALSFLALDIVALMQAKPRTAFSWLLFALVAIWSVRIGGFLLRRVTTVGKDVRFDGMRENFFRFGKFWLGQAITAWVLMLPAIFAQSGGGKISPLVMAGTTIWLVGFWVEAIADYQKFRFKQLGGKGWIGSGLWRYARHPNYFGEIAVWVGIYVFCFGALSTFERLYGLASPGIIAAVLLLVSGVPILEKSADKRWGNNPAYQRYKANTRLLVPLPATTKRGR